MSEPVSAPLQDEPFEAYRFSIEIRVPGLSQRLCSAAFAECDGPSVTLETRTIREGGSNLPRIEFTGGRTYGLVTLRRGMTGDFGLWNWVDAFLQEHHPRSDLRATAEILLLAPGGGSDRARFVLRRCLPVRFKAPALDALRGTIAIEELQLAYESLSVVGPGAKPSGEGEHRLVKAQLCEMDAGLGKEATPGFRATVQFNPEQLRVSFRREVTEEWGAAKGTTGVSRLSVALLFDATTLPAEEGPVIHDVRQLTREVGYFMSTPATHPPRGVRLTWGTFQFDGFMEFMEETLELFSSDGRPLRARVQVELVRNEIVDSDIRSR